MNIFSEARKARRPLILDGAMGSLLQQKGFESGGASWMTEINEKNPEKIIEIHKEYIVAGADIITTNTFRTNPAAFDAAEAKNISKYVENAVKLAKESVRNSSVIIAGSNPPAEDCYQSERLINNKILKLNHHNHIDLLINNGVDFILNETFSHLDEIMLVCDYCWSENIPYIISLYLNDELRLLSGETLKDTLNFIRARNPLAIGINCISSENFEKAFKNMDINYNWGFYLNCGFNEHHVNEIKCRVSPKTYGEIVKKYLEYQPSFIGACCGSSPKHIKTIKRILDETSI
ncbi:MAG: homocysteine S-methyltransferase family protein [Bacteroidetes bacterium]|nr:homocysteine S-methyltransferase family protein [Bacteroidota bacterium]